MNSGPTTTSIGCVDRGAELASPRCTRGRRSARPPARARSIAPSTYGVRPLALMPTTASSSPTPSTAIACAPDVRVVLGALARRADRDLPARDHAEHAVGVERRPALARVEHADPPRRPGADVDQPPARLEPLDDRVDRRRDRRPRRRRPPRARSRRRRSSAARARRSAAGRSPRAPRAPLRWTGGQVASWGSGLVDEVTEAVAGARAAGRRRRARRPAARGRSPSVGSRKRRRAAARPRRTARRRRTNGPVDAARRRGGRARCARARARPRPRSRRRPRRPSRAASRRRRARTTAITATGSGGVVDGARRCAPRRSRASRARAASVGATPPRPSCGRAARRAQARGAADPVAAAVVAEQRAPAVGARRAALADAPARSPRARDDRPRPARRRARRGAR